MYIDKIAIKGYRSIGSSGIEIDCNKGLNIIIGENNSGKTAIIDALRIALSIGDYKRGIYVKPSDFHINLFGKQSKTINIDLYFSDLTMQEATAFFLLTDGTDTTKAELHLEYTLYLDKNGKQKVREEVKGGPNNNPVPRETLENISLLYLGAIRNAETDLRPAKTSQIAGILYSVANEADRKRIEDMLVKTNHSIATDSAVKKTEEIINRNLLNIEKDEMNEQVHISLIDPQFDSVATALKIDYVSERYLKITKEELKAILDEFSLTEDDIKEFIITGRNDPNKKFVNLKKLYGNITYTKLYDRLSSITQNISHDISSNGLGYNNLLHMATSLGDLQENPSDEEIRVLLIEEPEAHLHPQLLELLFDFFRKANSDSKIQIFMTSHSPSLVAKADLDDIHIITSKLGKKTITSIKNSSLDVDLKDDLKRYLDVTKSQMLFAKRVIFVEGISEALLLNSFAKLLKKPLDKHSIEVVSLGGVAFEPFAKLFIKEDEHSCLNIPWVIISDDDRCTNNEDTYKIKNETLVYSSLNVTEIIQHISKGEISHRAKKLVTFSPNNVKLATKTLEYELAKIEGNIPILLKVLQSHHPDITNDIRNRMKQTNDDGSTNPIFETADKIAVRLWVAIRDCKGAFAQDLSREIENGISKEGDDFKFEVPQYIKEAFSEILK